MRCLRPANGFSRAICMLPYSGPQKRILSLIDGYQASFGYQQANGQRMDAALYSRPGHWFLVGRRWVTNGVDYTVGSPATDLKRRGFETAVVNNNHYARVSTSDGKPLTDFVTRQPPYNPQSAPQQLKSDSFGWSSTELSSALATARAWLFPIEGIAA